MVDKRTEDGQPPEGQDRQFTLPENPYAHLPGLEEAARKFQHAGVVNDAPSLHLASKRDEDTITANDLLPVEAAIAATCHAAGVPQARIDEIIAELRSHMGAEKSELPKIVKEAKEVARHVVNETVAAKSETPEQKIEKLWGEIKELNKKADALFDELDEFSTPEEKKRRKELQAALETETDNKRRIELQRELNALDKKVAERAKEQSEPGSKAHESGKELGDNADERKVLTSKLSATEVATTIAEERKIVTPPQSTSQTESEAPAQIAATSSIPLVTTLPSVSVPEGDTGTLASPQGPNQVTKVDGPVQGGTGF